MKNKEFFENAKALAEERGISIQDVYDNFSKGLENAYKKAYGNSSCKVVINPDKNEILLYGVYVVVEEYTPKEVLEEKPAEEKQDTIAEMLVEDAKTIKASYKVGDIVEIPVNIKDLSRTAVGAAKSVYTQGLIVRQREVAYDYFKAKEGTTITATVSNMNEKYITLKLEKDVIASLPVSELLPNDQLVIGQNISVYVKRVENNTKNPKVIVSRNDKSFLNRLMEDNIPELKEGKIEIKGIARDAGDRTKIALFSNDPQIDPIGACVGEGGSRIRAIVDKLGGEKIDLYKWSENPEELIPNSLQPASVLKVLEINPKDKTSRVVVPDDQLSLAIGKSGQNVRLAVQSCGWKIDIVSTSQATEDGLLN